MCARGTEKIGNDVLASGIGVEFYWRGSHRVETESRAEFLKMLQQRAAARGVKLPGKVASDPTDLGKVLTDLHEKPGQLRDILGGGQPQGQAPGSNPILDILKSPQVKAVLAGIAATVVKRVTQGSSRTA